jgi:uncharacterized protein (TIGR02217 family)
MAFHDSAVFPTTLDLGTAGGPSFENVIQESPSGRSVRIARMTEPVMRYEIVRQDVSLTDAASLLRFVRARHGSLHGFRLLDFADFSTATDNVSQVAEDGGADRHQIGVGDGSTTVFRLSKTYTDSGESVVRRIEKPMTLAQAQAVTNVCDYLATLTTGQHLRVWVDGTEKTEGTDYTVDYSTGTVTFGTAPTTGHVILWAGYFHVPVRFGVEADKFLRVLAPVAITRSFDGLTMVEEKSDTALLAMQSDPGGAKLHTVATTSAAISFADGKVQLFDCDGVASFNLLLPEPADWMLGGPVFVIFNVGATIGISVRDYTGAALPAALTIAAGSTARLYLAPDGSGGYDWVAA